MAFNVGQYLKGFYDTAKAAGAKKISSDFALEIEGFESNWILTKQCPWPVMSSQGAIEVPMPLGSVAAIPQQSKIYHQGPITFYETTAGTIDQELVNLIANGGTFNAKIYEGTPEKFLHYKTIRDCFVEVEDPDRDWENRSQVLTISGTIHFHYFGEFISGNSKAY